MHDTSCRNAESLDPADALAIPSWGEPVAAGGSPPAFLGIVPCSEAATALPDDVDDCCAVELVHLQLARTFNLRDPHHAGGAVQLRETVGRPRAGATVRVTSQSTSAGCARGFKDVTGPPPFSGDRNFSSSWKMRARSLFARQRVGSLRNLGIVTFRDISFSKRVRENSRLHFRPHARLHAHCADPMLPEEAVVTRPGWQLATSTGEARTRLSNLGLGG